ncbi:MAG: carbohydrate ABC transporter permease [Clostridia bacterium]|nr:carbohydrate ABC transporter permease [Clostridia bacterium]
MTMEMAKKGAAREKKTLSKSARNRIGNSIRYAVLIFLTIFAVFPMYWIAVTGFKAYNEIINLNEVTYWPHTWTLENFRKLFTEFRYFTYVGNTVKVGVIAGLIVVALTSLGGYGLARYSFKGKAAVTGLFLLVQIAPVMLSQIPIYAMFSKLHLIGTHTGLVLLYISMSVPFNTVTMRSFFERVPVAIEEAAFVDGCNRVQTLFFVVLPNLLPGLVTVFIYGFTVAWNDVITATLFVQTRSRWTVNVGLKSLIGKVSVDWGQLMAGAFLTMIPSIILFIVTQKALVSGSPMGSVKG